MKGRQRLRFAPIGELRRRWASLASVKDLNQRYEVVIARDFGSDEKSEEMLWLSSLLSLQGSRDPSHVHQPEGLGTCFWEDDSIDIQGENFQV